MADSANMTWEQKFAACMALSPATLHMRKPGDWYVSQNVEIKNGIMLMGEYGNGRTPEEAVSEHFAKLTNLQSNQYLVVNAYSDDRIAVRWNGFMWAPITEATRTVEVAA